MCEMTEQRDRQEIRYKYANIAIFCLCFLVVFLVDMFVGYSKGDDAVHQILAEQYNLWEFIMNCGTSRISKKISLYYVMRSDILMWRVLNAFVFTLFIGAVSKLVFIIRQVSDNKKQFYIRFILLVSMCFVHISVVGFTVFWVTGTQDYLWPFAFGLMSLIPEIQSTYGKSMNLLTFLGTVFCAVWGGLGQEQISFMLLCMSFLNAMYKRGNGVTKKDELYFYILFFVRVSCFLFLIFAPMNQARLAESSYYTDFRELTLVEHLFLTVQWELSAFANEMKLLFISIWMILAWGYRSEKNWKKLSLSIILIIITIPSFLGIPFLNTLGVRTVTDMGILVEDIVAATDNTVSFGTMSIWNWISFVYWMIAAAVVTPYLLKDRKICCCLYMLGFSLPLMMIVSSSMYVSGGRVFWISAVLFSGIIGILLTEKFVENKLLIAGGWQLCLEFMKLAWMQFTL